MKIVALALALLLAGSAEAKTQKYWTCTDAAGHKSAQDFPCPEPLVSGSVQPALQAPAETPPSPQVQRQVSPQQKPARVDFVGGMLKPLFPMFGVIFFLLLAITAFKFWVT